jgi:hypothetical protein
MASWGGLPLDILSSVAPTCPDVVELVIGVCSGAVLVITAWAWCDARRIQGDQAAQLRKTAEEHVEQRALILRCAADSKRHAETLHDIGRDLDVLAERVGVERYARGKR